MKLKDSISDDQIDKLRFQLFSRMSTRGNRQEMIDLLFHQVNRYLWDRIGDQIRDYHMIMEIHRNISESVREQQ